MKMLQIIVCAALLALPPLALHMLTSEQTKVPVTQNVEVAFSPDGQAEALVLKVIRSAKTSIRLAGYTFTSPTVVRTLTDAKKRGIDVAELVDYSNTSRILKMLVSAGIPTRIISAYPIHHDKYIVVDGLHVETGSFNYTIAAARRNSENVLVVWNNPVVAGQYIAHWQNRWEQGQPYQSSRHTNYHPISDKRLQF